MNGEFHLGPRFGTFPDEGALAAEFRLKEIEPSYETYEVITLDFSGVRNINSSFANTLLAPLIEQHGEAALKKLRFRGCNPVVRLMLESALALGVERASGHGRLELA